MDWARRPWRRRSATSRRCTSIRGAHLYVDHSLNTSYPTYAGIPAAQQDGVSINFGSYDANPISGYQDEEYLTLVNPNTVAVDISGWKLSGGVDFTFEDGTVIPAGGTLYVSPNVVAFRARATGPSGGQTLFIEGNYSGHLSLFGETVQLLNLKDGVVGTLTIASNPSAVQQNLRITEVMYHPADPPKNSTYVNDDFEYVELENISATQTLDLTGVRFTDGINFDFTASNVTSLAPGAKVLVVSNLAAFQSRYGTGLNAIIAGQYGVVTATDLAPLHLSNSGEKITLVDSVGETVLSFTYSDDWFKQTDGSGNSLVIRDPAGDRSLWDQPEGWFASHSASGSPGSDESPDYPVDAIVVNEVLSHTDITNPGDWVEFYNTTSSPINIGGWYISDSDSNLKKYQIAAGTMIPANGYITFNHHDNFGNPADPGYITEFSFNEYGETVYLTSASGGAFTTYETSQSFDASDRDQDGTYPYAGDPSVTFSADRYVTSTGAVDFVETSQTTYNAANTAPRVGPVVINEINYHPVSGQTAYVELKNITANALDLYDPNNYNPLAPTLRDTWELGGGISFSFPQGATIPASGYALVVDADPTWYRTEYNIPASVPIYGPYIGALNKSGDTVELLRPGQPDEPPSTGVPYYRVDQVTYDDSAPWPKSADGFGASLNRVSATAFGDDVTNWTAGHPTPGGDNAAYNAASITITTPATATPGTVTGTTTALSVADSDIQGESTVLYDWSATTMPAGATYPTFSANDTNAAKNTTVTFYQTGAYTFTVRMADTYGGVTTSSVNVTVVDTINGLAILPNGALVLPSQTLQLTPIWSNQFGQPTSTLSNAPAVTWSISPTSGAGTITQQGLYTAPSSAATATIMATSGSFVATTTVQSLVPTGYWKFDDGSGTTAADSSGNAHPGTLVNSPTWTTGEFNGGIALNGTSQYVTVPALNFSSNTVTITGWVKRSGTQSDYTGIVFYRNGSGTASGISMRSSGVLAYHWNDNSSTYNWASGLTVPDGVWTFVALVITANNATMYMQPVGSAMQSAVNPVANAARSFSSTTYIGEDSGGGRLFKGSLDDIRIYNTSLTAGNVASLGNLPPTVATAAAAAPSPATGTSTLLSVLGADNLGEGNLAYTWSTTGSPPAAVSFSANGTNAAKNTTAAFTKAGNYGFLVTIADQGGLSTTSSVTETVNQTLTTISLAGQPLAATAFDQFSNALANQPAFDAGTDTIMSTLTLGGAVTVLPANGSQLTIAGGISGPSSLTVDDLGTVVLTGLNSYTGGTNVALGTLVVANSYAIASGTNLSVGAAVASFFSSPPVQTAAFVSVETAAVVQPAEVATKEDAAVIVPGAKSLPAVPALTANQPKSESAVAAGALEVTFADTHFASASTQRIAANLMWLRQSAIGPDDSDQQHRKDAAQLALESIFAQYGGTPGEPKPNAR